MKLKKAKDDIHAANLLMKPENNPTNDEGIYDLAAYHAQQAVEKILKNVLINNFDYDEKDHKFRTHNIAALIDMLEGSQIESKRSILDIPNDLRIMSSDISHWEANSRYGDDLSVVKEDIRKVLDMCSTMIKQLEDRKDE